MSGLPTPVRRVLREEADDRAIDRVWRGIARKRAERARRRVRRWPFVAAVAAALLAPIAWRSLGPREEAPKAAAAQGPLKLATGGDIVAVTAGAERVSLVLSERSEVHLDPGTRIEPLENTATAFTLLLGQGRALFDVTPGGSRRWSIECGLATVEVVGTRFWIEKDAGRVRVTVERGAVLVKGERVPERVRRVNVGESFEIEAQAPAAPLASDVSTAASILTRTAAAASSATRTAAAASPPPPPAPPSWRPLAQRGEHAKAYEALGPSGIARAAERASVDDLLALADVARLSGHAADAVLPLSRVVSEHAGDARAPLAAFTLGRVQLDVLGDAPRAAQSFAQAIALGVPSGLVEDAYARLVEARARAGDRAGAQEAAAEYERRFPNGRRRDAIRKWADGK